jgi:phage gp45-like
MDLWAKLNGLLGRGRIKLIDDSGPVQKAQVDVGPQGYGVRDNTPVLGMYGLASRPPKDSDAIVLFLGGDRTDGVVIATGRQVGRLLSLIEGEAALVNQVRNTFAKLADDGKLHINCDVVIDGDLQVTGDGALGGDLAVAGNGTVDGNLTVDGLLNLPNV